MKTFLSPPHYNKGFTLTELLIVLAILSIIAAIAYPSYTNSVLKSHRRAAQAEMQDLAQSLERDFTLNDAYSDLISDSKFIPGKAVQERYNLSLSANGASYTITATPKGPQAEDSCGVLTLDVQGQTTPTKDGCWE